MKLTYQNEILFQRTEMGTFQINTSSEIDFYYAMGFAHAYDRTTQLLLMRILGKGNASQHLMSTDEMLEMDIFFRKMNWKSELESEVAQLTPEELKLANAYCDGVNKYILHKRPTHFKMIGYKPEPWTVADSMLISRMTGYISLAQSQGEVERFFLQLVKQGLPEDQIHELFPNILKGCDFELLKQIQFEEKLVPDGVKWLNMISAAIASNNWIVSGNRSKSGKPILANDPHLETNRLPNIWYELSISLNDRFFKGCTMPGLPACLIGRTNDLAWGATYTFMDAMDSWIEDVKEGKYLKNDQRHDFIMRTEIIKRKKKPDHILEIYENDHGTLDGLPVENGYYLTTRWASNSAGHKSVRAIRNMFFARDVEEGMNQIGQLEVSFNWVLSDIHGNIGYQMSGLLPKRKDGWSGFYPVPGWLSENDWISFVHHKDLPRIYNPEKGFFVTCNQDLNEYGNVTAINIAMGDYRYRRVSEMINSTEKHDSKSFQKIQQDVYSIQAKELTDYFLPHLNDQQKDLLSNWDFCYRTSQIEPTIFEELYKGLISELLATNLGYEVAQHILNDTGVLADFYLNFDRIIHNENSSWFKRNSRDQMIQNVVKKLEHNKIVQWGKENRFNMTNMFFGGKLPGFMGYDKGPIELKGGRSTVHQGQIYRSAGRLTSFTPSYRFITDMSTDFIESALAGGASDHRWSKYYANEVNNWLTGKYKKL
ncbi:MAG: penicillin acylase family protein [Flavobacteriales bacterium]|nr:penicillin acylase family protein [Flavobacteriales bacterium]